MKITIREQEFALVDASAWGFERWHQYIEKTGLIRFLADAAAFSIPATMNSHRTAATATRDFLEWIGIPKETVDSLNVDEVGSVYLQVLPMIQPALSEAAQKWPALEESYSMARLGFEHGPTLRKMKAIGITLDLRSKAARRELLLALGIAIERETGVISQLLRDRCMPDLHGLIQQREKQLKQFEKLRESLRFESVG